MAIAYRRFVTEEQEAALLAKGEARGEARGQEKGQMIGEVKALYQIVKMSIDEISIKLGIKEEKVKEIIENL